MEVLLVVVLQVVVLDDLDGLVHNLGVAYYLAVVLDNQHGLVVGHEVAFDLVVLLENLDGLEVVHDLGVVLDVGVVLDLAVVYNWDAQVVVHDNLDDQVVVHNWDGQVVALDEEVVLDSKDSPEDFQKGFDYNDDLVVVHVVVVHEEVVLFTNVAKVP